MWQLILALAVTAVLMWWAFRLSRDVIGAIEVQRKRDDDILDSEHPVFSRARIVEAYRRSVSASQHLQAVESALYNDPAFKTAAREHSIPEDISTRMLAVSEAIVQAERAWYSHSAMMDANLSVIAGRHSRDEALAIAEKRLDLLSKDILGGDARKIRDEWKARLEDPNAPPRDPSPRPYTNPWSDFAKQHLYHW